MSDTLRDRIAKALHRIYSPSLDADDWDDEPHMVQDDYRRDADAILALPGIAVVELPEPDDGRDDWLDATVKRGLARCGVLSVDVELDPGAVIRLSVEYARDLAAALLSAADYAERDQ